MEQETSMTFTHNGREWTIVIVGGSFFAREDHGNDTGPYSTAEQARGWVEAIRL